MGTKQGKVGGKPFDGLEAFVSRWQGRDGGQERANYAMFLHELCDALGLQPPHPAGDRETNDFVFERVVKEPGRDGHHLQPPDRPVGRRVAPKVGTVLAALAPVGFVAPSILA